MSRHIEIVVVPVSGRFFLNASWGVKSRRYETRQRISRPRGHPTKRDSPNEIPVLMFVMVEQATGAFTLRSVSNIARLCHPHGLKKGSQVIERMVRPEDSNSRPSGS